MKNKIKIAVIGCGRMGSGIVSSMISPLTKANLLANGDVLELTVCDRNESKIIPFGGACKTTLDKKLAVSKAKYVFLCVQPSVWKTAVDGLDLTDKIVFSIIAGVTIDDIAKVTGAKRVVRIMPNVNATVGESTNIFAMQGVERKDRFEVLEIIGSFGRPCEVDEQYIDGITGVSGCSPAFIFMTIKSLYQKAVEVGIDKTQALEIVMQTVIGSAVYCESALSQGKTFDELIDSVCTKGGATEQGVKYLVDNNYCDVLANAVDVANSRVIELGENNEND